MQGKLIAALTRPPEIDGAGIALTGILLDRRAPRCVARKVSQDGAGRLLERGRFRETPASWTRNPEATLSQKQFFEVLEICVEKLPAQAARVFLMREWLELPTEEICHELGISTSNCWVTLYRARMRLRACLELNWFQEGREASNGSKNS